MNVRIIYRMLTTVTSQVSGLPACHRVRVSPSGRLLSVLARPHGSLVTGTPAAVRDRGRLMPKDFGPIIIIIIRIKSGRLLVRTVLDERVVQKHRIETLNKNRGALEKE